MIKYFLIIFLLTTVTNLTNCGGVKDDSKPTPSGEKTTASCEANSCLGLPGFGCCHNENLNIVCVQETDPVKATDIAFLHLHNSPHSANVITASFYHIIVGNNKAKLKDCIKIHNVDSVYGFSPSSENACHSMDDKCLKVKEDWIKKQQSKGFHCTHFSADNKNGPGPSICLTNKKQ